MGTGNIVHNLSIMDWDPESQPYDWALRFNQYIKDKIVINDIQSICNYQEYGEDAELAIPTLDHYCPLLYVLGAREDNDQVNFESDYIVYRSLGMTSVVFQ